jgi:SRSO17 transposase
LSDLERKSIEPIALRYEREDAVRGMQSFFKTGAWDDKKMLSIYQDKLSSALCQPDGMFNIDGCDFPKKGKDSAAVMRQCHALAY